MTRDEWETIALLIENCWRGEFDEVQSSAYFTMLGRFDHGQVMAALHRITEDGKPFVPSVPEIIAAIRRLEIKSLPSWTDVWASMKAALALGSEQAALDRMRECHPVAEAFVAREGIERLRYEPFFDPDYGALRIKELQQRWIEFSEQAMERKKRGLAIEATKRTSTGLNRVTEGQLLPEGVSEE